MRTRDLLLKAADWIEKNPERWIAGSQCDISSKNPKKWGFCAQGVILAMEFGEDWPKQEQALREQLDELNLLDTVSCAIDTYSDMSDLTEVKFTTTASTLLERKLFKKNPKLEDLWEDIASHNDENTEIFLEEMAYDIVDAKMRRAKKNWDWEKREEEFEKALKVVEKKLGGVDNAGPAQAAAMLRDFVRQENL